MRCAVLSLSLFLFLAHSTFDCVAYEPYNICCCSSVPRYVLFILSYCAFSLWNRLPFPKRLRLWAEELYNKRRPRLLTLRKLYDFKMAQWVKLYKGHHVAYRNDISSLAFLLFGMKSRTASSCNVQSSSAFVPKMFWMIFWLCCHSFGKLIKHEFPCCYLNQQMGLNIYMYRVWMVNGES